MLSRPQTTFSASTKAGLVTLSTFLGQEVVSSPECLGNLIGQNAKMLRNTYDTVPLTRNVTPLACRLRASRASSSLARAYSINSPQAPARALAYVIERAYKSCCALLASCLRILNSNDESPPSLPAVFASSANARTGRLQYWRVQQTQLPPPPSRSDQDASGMYKCTSVWTNRSSDLRSIIIQLSFSRLCISVKLTP